MGTGEDTDPEISRDSLYVSGRTRDWLKIKTNAGREEMRVRMETWGS
ncbi:MAG: hypothetical protein ACR2HX_10885 [Pyrinomonadaceae bacterium]